MLKCQTSALKITFENLPIIKIKASGKKVAHHGWATRKFFRNENFESVWTRLQKIYVLSHAFHDFFKRSSRGGFPIICFKRKKLGVIKNDRQC